MSSSKFLKYYFLTLLSILLAYTIKSEAFTVDGGLKLEDGTLTALDTRVYNSGSTSWNKPSFANMVYVWCVGGGGGGGSGAKNTTGASGGGGGGASGSVGEAWIRADDLPSTVTVTIGAKGTGGASITADSTSGADGVNGNDSSFGTYVYGYGGAKGVGGSKTGNAAGGTYPNGIPWNGRSGGMGTLTNGSFGTACSGSFSYGPGPGGGGSGAVNTTSAQATPTATVPATATPVPPCATACGYSVNTTQSNGCLNGVAISTPIPKSGSTATSGAPGASFTLSTQGRMVGGGGGGGGGAFGSTFVNGGSGGNGGTPGGGGGGGGGSINSTGNSGKGGDGGDGICWVISYQ